VALGEALKCNTVLKELDISGNCWDDTAHYYGDKGDGPGFAKGISKGLSGNGALSSVNLVKNEIGIDQAGALASMLKEHPTLKSLCGNKGNETELDMSGKMNSAGDAIMLVAEIIDNGALSAFTFSGEYSSRPVTMETTMTKADFSGKKLGVSGSMMVAAFLPKCQ
jgi:hypothetical protein